MPSREEAIFSAADQIWAKGKRPTNRSVIAICGGSTRDVAPILRAWWQTKTCAETAMPPQRVLKELEQQMDEQRKYLLLQLDTERQRGRALEDQIAALNRTLSRYRKLLSDTTLKGENL